MDQDRMLREQLVKLLDWEDAHVNFETAVDGIDPEMRGAVPGGFAHSAWQLVEHLRIAQHDILEFCINPQYKEMEFPKDYWPASAEPPSDEAWEESLAAVKKDREQLQKLALDSSIDLFAEIPHGSGQTYLRELLLAADHNAYHVGQLVAVKKALI